MLHHAAIIKYQLKVPGILFAHLLWFGIETEDEVKKKSYFPKLGFREEWQSLAQIDASILLIIMSDLRGA